MSINKSIFYLLCNNGIIVNLYKLHFLSSHFSFQPNKRVFYLPTFPFFQPNTHEGKLNIFYHSIFPSFHFSTSPTKRTRSIFFFNFFSKNLKNKFVAIRDQTLKVHLVEGVEKWEDKKWGRDRKVRGWKRFDFFSYVFGWENEKVKRWKTHLFGWGKKWENEKKKCNLYEFTFVPQLHSI